MATLEFSTTKHQLQNTTTKSELYSSLGQLRRIARRHGFTVLKTSCATSPERLSRRLRRLAGETTLREIMGLPQLSEQTHVQRATKLRDYFEAPTLSSTLRAERNARALKAFVRLNRDLLRPNSVELELPGATATPPRFPGLGLSERSWKPLFYQAVAVGEEDLPRGVRGDPPGREVEFVVP